MKGWRRWRKEWYDPAKCRNNFSPLAPLRKAPFFCVFPTWTNHQLMNCKRKGTRVENLPRISYTEDGGVNRGQVTIRSCQMQKYLFTTCSAEKGLFFFVFPTWTDHQLINCKRKGTREENLSRNSSYRLTFVNMQSPREHRAIESCQMQK